MSAVREPFRASQRPKDRLSAYLQSAGDQIDSLINLSPVELLTVKICERNFLLSWVKGPAGNIFQIQINNFIPHSGVTQIGKIKIISNVSIK